MQPIARTSHPFTIHVRQVGGVGSKLLHVDWWPGTSQITGLAASLLQVDTSSVSLRPYSALHGSFVVVQRQGEILGTYQIERGHTFAPAPVKLRC